MKRSNEERQERWRDGMEEEGSTYCSVIVGLMQDEYNWYKVVRTC